MADFLYLSSGYKAGRSLENYIVRIRTSRFISCRVLLYSNDN